MEIFPIFQVNQNHQGRYTCTPYNAQGTQGSSGPMEVLVRKPPVFTVEPESLYQRKVGETVDMHCEAQEAEGTQKPTIQWLRVSTPLNHSLTHWLTQKVCRTQKTKMCRCLKKIKDVMYRVVPTIDGACRACITRGAIIVPYFNISEGRDSVTKEPRPDEWWEHYHRIITQNRLWVLPMCRE